MNVTLIDYENSSVLGVYKANLIHPLPLAGERVMIHTGRIQVEGKVVRRYWHLGNNAVTVELYLKEVVA